MERLGDLIPDKDKYLKNLPVVPSMAAPEPSDVPEPTTLPPEPQEETIPMVDDTQAPAQKTLDTPEAELMRMTLYKIKDQVDILLHLLDETSTLIPISPVSIPVSTPKIQTPEPTPSPSNDRILEGIFTGDKMRSDEGEVFDIPQNYASKSKLVVGDRMKLTIPPTGPFVYKQISQVERTRVRGELISGNSSGQWLVSSEGKNYKVLTASITFNKGRIGDEVVLIIPAVGPSDWGAVEHIIHRDL